MEATAIRKNEIGTGNLAGKVALVTGSSRGIGAAIAGELARCGAYVVINYMSAKSAADAVVVQCKENGGDAHAEPADVSKSDDVKALIERVFEKTKRIDILVNNAGIVRDRTFRKLTLEDWHEVIDTNLTSVMNTSHYVVPHMIDSGKGGRIVNVSSFVGQMGNFGQANYSAAKAGIIGFTKSLAIELARFQIMVNAVCPGFVNTEMWRSVPDSIREKILDRIPMHRVAEPGEIARGVRFLVSEADYMTGQSLNINGGIYMGW
ncbi:MAG TPA: 3-oxoacyl-ACP reductase family protein [Candidatus Acidoferrales bacterium]|nr:3-oxoacyl-ACP reductase family protein [Candidatus Acidoferrales bacterium]